MKLTYKRAEFTYTESFFVSGLFLLVDNHSDEIQSDIDEFINQVNALYDKEQPDEKWKIKYEFVPFDESSYNFTSNNIKHKPSFRNVRAKLIEAGATITEDHTH
jgi:hypothetical protein